jgi:CRISPR/Cas system-associated exonuclease Cas4 (RecB family)
VNKIEFDTVDENGNTIKLIVKKPTITDEANARFVSIDEFKRAVKSGAFLKEELETELRKRGIWDDDKQKTLESIHKEIREKLLALKKGGIKKSEARKLSIDIRVLRGRMVILLSERNKYDDFTVESQVENKKFNYYVYACTFNEEGNRVFSSVEEYENKANTKMAIDAAVNLSRITNGLDPDWQKKLPENKFLIDSGFANDNLELIDKDGHRITVDGKRIDSDYNYIKEVDGKEVVVDEDGIELDEDGLPKVESQPFLDD